MTGLIRPRSTSLLPALADPDGITARAAQMALRGALRKQEDAD